MLDHLVSLGLGDAGLQVFGEEYGHGFLEESWAGVKEESLGPLFGGIAGFFQKFALSGSEGIFAGVDTSGGEFEHVIGGGVAVLALQEDTRFGAGAVDGENDHGAGVPDDFADCGNTIWFDDIVASYVEDAALEYRL